MKMSDPVLFELTGKRYSVVYRAILPKSLMEIMQEL
jgi:hypothetical protein